MTRVSLVLCQTLGTLYLSIFFWVFGFVVRNFGCLQIGFYWGIWFSSWCNCCFWVDIIDSIWVDYKALLDLNMIGCYCFCKSCRSFHGCWDGLGWFFFLNFSLSFCIYIYRTYWNWNLYQTILIFSSSLVKS